MRMFIAFVFLMVAVPIFADSDSARIVFDHECKQIDTKTTGFTCDGFKTGGDGPWFTFRTAAKNLPSQSRYEFEKIVQRYFDLGGHFFYVARADRPKKEYAACYPTREHGWSCTKFCGQETLESVKECK